MYRSSFDSALLVIEPSTAHAHQTPWSASQLMPPRPGPGSPLTGTTSTRPPAGVYRSIASSAQQLTSTREPSQPIPVPEAAALTPDTVPHPLPAGRWNVTSCIGPIVAAAAGCASITTATTTSIPNPPRLTTRPPPDNPHEDTRRSPHDKLDEQDSDEALGAPPL